jgi:hypothetical protein
MSFGSIILREKAITAGLCIITGVDTNIQNSLHYLTHLLKYEENLSFFLTKTIWRHEQTIEIEFNWSF